MPNIESRPDLYSIERLQTIFRYDEFSGLFYVKKSDQYRNCETPLGIVDDGYIVIIYDGFYIFAHRLAFAIKLGFWPVEEVDHKNRIKHDNSWSNLREATRLHNVVNRGLRKDNSTGISGVSLRRSGSYRVRIDGERIGDFKDFFEACCVRKSAELLSVVRKEMDLENETISEFAGKGPSRRRVAG